jgi:hypothetical protein
MCSTQLPHAAHTLCEHSGTVTASVNNDLYQSTLTLMQPVLCTWAVAASSNMSTAKRSVVSHCAILATGCHDWVITQSPGCSDSSVLWQIFEGLKACVLFPK